MKGYIGGSAITMYFYIKNGEISGRYYYDSIKQFIDIKGSVSGDSFYIDEFVNNNKIASLNGNISNGALFSGEWLSADRNNQFDFSFSRNNSFVINRITIINSSLNVKEENGKFESSRDAVLIENQKKLQSLDKISIDVDGIKSLNEERISEILSGEIMSEYDAWKDNISNKMDFDIKKEIKVSYLDDRIISFAIDNYSYAGGNRAVDTSSIYIYSVETGERIGTRLSELISNPNDIDLINLMRSKLLRSFSERDFFDFYGIELSDVFDVTPTGIKFIWPIYKVAGYSQGVIEIEFTFSELKPFIKEDSKFLYLFE